MAFVPVKIRVPSPLPHGSNIIHHYDIRSFQWTKDGLTMTFGVLVMLNAVEDLRLEPEPALTQLLSTVVQSVWEMPMKHERVTKTPVQVMKQSIILLASNESRPSLNVHLFSE